MNSNDNSHLGLDDWEFLQSASQFICTVTFRPLEPNIIPVENTLPPFEQVVDYPIYHREDTRFLSHWGPVPPQASSGWFTPYVLIVYLIEHIYVTFFPFHSTRCFQFQCCIENGRMCILYSLEAKQKMFMKPIRSSKTMGFIISHRGLMLLTL